MKPLPPAPSPAAVLSFDFDGTLHDPASKPPVPPGFFELIASLRDERGIVWGINTGRSLPQLIEGFIESRFPFLPDWVVTRETEIHLPNDFARWVPHQPWNRECQKLHDKLFKRSRKLLARFRSLIEEHTGAQWIEVEGEPAGVISRTEEEMAWVVATIQPLAAEEPLLFWQRNSIYLRFGHRDLHKGSSLTEIAKLCGLSARHCFAIGDSHNDLGMLDPAHAAMPACPANAICEVAETIRHHGGYISPFAHGEGAVDAVRHYFC